MLNPWLVKGVIIALIAVIGAGLAVNEMRKGNEANPEPPTEDCKKDDEEPKPQDSKGKSRDLNGDDEETAISTGIRNEDLVRRRGVASTANNGQSSSCITPPPRTSSISSRENELQDEMSFLNALEQANEARRKQLEQEEKEIASRKAELELKRQTLDRELVDFEKKLQQLSVQSNVQLDDHPWLPTFSESSVNSSGIHSTIEDKSLQQQSADTDMREIDVDSPNVFIDDNNDDDDEEEENAENADDEQNETQSVSGKSVVSVDALSEHFSENSWSHISSE
ncbi:hypothetical protein BDF22DRAFT_656291 [Syncephalis plumigaleata]|nr:hypothetical protein BDF22DRAFT_656291 [Syncephalis plumigaleata]